MISCSSVVELLIFFWFLIFVNSVTFGVVVIFHRLTPGLKADLEVLLPFVRFLILRDTLSSGMCVSTSPLNTATINRSCQCSFEAAAVLALVFLAELFDRVLTWCLLVLVGCSLLRCVLFLVQSTMCFLTRAKQLSLASPPAPSASSPEPRSIRYFWVRSRCVLELALSFIFHLTMVDSSHWPWVLVGRVGKGERLTVAARFSSISRLDVDQAAMTRTSVR